VLFGTPDDTFEGCEFGVDVGSCLRELKEEINSIECGDSPRRLLK